ncbi:MAG TPA: OmpA family protein, partial [Lutibacter sp.]|nr:OmpA family protein [Lutibacter sp.]
KTRKGYFTSNRPQGKGGDDIYSFTQETAIKTCTQTIKGDVRNVNTDEIIKDATVNIFSEKGEWLNRFSTGGDGKFLIKLNKCEKNYKLEATKKYYDKDSTIIIYSPDKKIHQVSLFLEKQEIDVVEEVSEAKTKKSTEIISLEVKTIDFILNKFEIRQKSAEELNKVIKIMKENPTMIVEFISHTDSRGPDDWNMELSIKRAEEVVHYITSKGIAYNRIYGRGYGETQPLNHCVNGVECSELEFIVNRRTQFIVLAQ